MKVNKYFVFILFIAILNGINQANILYKYFVYLQIISVLFYSFKDIKKAFFLHIIFMITSNNFLLTSDDYGVIINYSKLKFIDNFSYSYLVLFFFFFIALIIGKNNRKINFKNKYIKKFYFSINFFCLYPIILGILGLTFNKYYNFSSFFYYSVYCLNLMIYFFIIISLYNRKDYQFLNNTLLTLIFVSCIHPFILKILNQHGEYGGIKIWMSLDIISFSVILFFVKGFFSKFFLLIYILSFKFMASGKSIFFFIIAIYKLTTLNFSGKKKLILNIILILVFIIFLINKNSILSIIASNKNNLFYYKIREMFSMIEFWNLKEMYSSPKIRVIEGIDIILNYLEKPLFSIFGFGFGGYYQDISGLFKEVDLEMGAFSKEIINSGIFPNAHVQLLNIFLFNGFFGLIFIYKYCVLFWKNIKKYPLAIISFLWLFFIFYFNVQVMIFSLLSTYLFFIEYNEKNKI